MHDDLHLSPTVSAENPPPPLESQPGFIPRAKLPALLAELRSAGKRVVMTNGCFDMLHVGHARFLEESAALGDALIVGVNEDGSVRARKGPDRPARTLAKRVEFLLSLDSVDYVTSFAEPEVTALVHEIQPDLYTKGGDYSADTIDESLARALGEASIPTAFLSYVDGVSTTKILNDLRFAP